MKNYGELIAKVEEIGKNLDEYKPLVDADLINIFQSCSRTLEKDIGDIVEDGRNLRVGIIGAVKAGKSSFLNAMLFNGRDVLPRAATPMTASLTRISYSKTPGAKVVFYNSDDWAGIVKASKEYEAEIKRLTEKRLREERERRKITPRGKEKVCLDINKEVNLSETEEYERAYNAGLLDVKSKNPELAGCDELVKMSHGLWTDKLLGTENMIPFGELKEYAGSSGKYTPLVKWIEIALDASSMAGLEIIDTPGLNDPIVSRANQTQKFIEKCDVVFLLSYSGQFLTAEDMALLRENLPSGGVRHVFLVGSKFDSAICDNLKKAKKLTFGEVCGYTASELQNHVLSVLKKNTGRDCKISETISKMITKEQKPYFISSILFNISRKIENGVALLPEENKVLENMKRFDGFRASDANFLRDFSNIDLIRNYALAKVREDKDKIISEKVSKCFSDNKSKFLGILENINIHARDRQLALQTEKAENLEGKLDNFKRALNLIRGEVKNCLELEAVKAQKYIIKLQMDVESLALEDKDINVEQKTERDSYKTGFFIFKKTHYKTIITYHASVNDALKNLRKFANEAKRVISQDLDKMFDIRRLKNDLKQIILSAFDTSSADFNENEIIVPVEILLEKLMIPSFPLDAEPYTEMIVSEFSSARNDGLLSLWGGFSGAGTDITGEDIERLVQVQNHVLGKMTKSICDDLSKHADEVERSLLSKAATFVDDIEGKIEDNVKQLEELLANKETNLRKFDDFINAIKKSKREIPELREQR
jgi:GTPase Era involved in 16S rRNA processing